MWCAISSRDLPPLRVWILDLRTNFGKRLSLPGHFTWRKMPLWMSGHATRFKVSLLVADRAAHRLKPESVRAAFDWRLVRAAGITLARTVARRMAVQAPRTGEHLAELNKECS